MIKIFDLIELRKRYNALAGRYEVLEDSVKDKLLDAYLEQINVPLELDRLRKENKNLRLKVKSLKEIIKESKEN